MRTRVKEELRIVRKFEIFKKLCSMIESAENEEEQVKHL